MDTTQVIKPVDMQMVKDYLRENLDIRVDFQSPSAWESGKVVVTLLLEGEEFCSDKSSIYL